MDIVNRSKNSKTRGEKPKVLTKSFRRTELQTNAGIVPMIYPVVKYGNAVLEKQAKPIEKFDEELAKLCQDMFESMYAANGVGLAAPQIGIGKRLAVIDVTGGKNPEAKIVLANPEVVHAEGEQREEEGCLSVPGVRGKV